MTARFPRVWSKGSLHSRVLARSLPLRAAGRCTRCTTTLAPCSTSSWSSPDNGGLVVDHGKVIFKADMPVEDYRRMARITSEMGDYGFICGLDGCYVDAKAKHYEDFIRTFYTKCEFVDDLTQVDVPANKFTVMFPNNDALDQIGAYRDRIGGNFQYCCGGVMWVDIVPEGVSKGAALRRVSDITGIDTADMAAFGDAPNDARPCSRPWALAT